jgi:hypothetical protein
MGESSFHTTLADTAYHARRTEDQNLAGRIAHTIRSEMHSAVHDLEIRVAPNSIHLLGECTSYYNKQLAQEITRRFCEKRIICNEIEVTAPKPK